MIFTDNKFKSWLGFHKILWWHNDLEPGPDELQNGSISIGNSQLEDRDVMSWSEYFQRKFGKNEISVCCLSLAAA